MIKDDHDRLKTLLDGYIDGNISSADAAELTALLKNGGHDDAITAMLTARSENVAPVTVDAQEVDRMILRVKEAAGGQTRIRRMAPYLRVAVAAAILLVIITGSYQWLSHRQLTEVARRYGGDALPGGNKAVLVLADGSTITLDNAPTGKLSQQGGAAVMKTAEGGLTYNDEPGLENEVKYNTLSTPLGGQYQIRLPDGTAVWLNAGSSLRFPTAFTDGNRTVELSGEAYFEIAKDAAHPFFVKTNRDLTIEVLGTHFNVQAYAEDQQLTTTLLEGRVNVKHGNERRLLSPGQQVVAAAGGRLGMAEQADTEIAVAWKNGIFRFNDADIETVMKQLSRWYNLNVEYEGEPVKEYFNATIPKNVPVSKVFELLELTGLVHFKIKGTTVIVTQ